MRKKGLFKTMHQFNVEDIFPNVLCDGYLWYYFQTRDAIPTSMGLANHYLILKKKIIGEIFSLGRHNTLFLADIFAFRGVAVIRAKEAKNKTNQNV